MICIYVKLYHIIDIIMKNQNKKKSEIEVRKHVNIIYDIVFACLLIFSIGSIIGSYF